MIKFEALPWNSCLIDFCLRQMFFYVVFCTTVPSRDLLGNFQETEVKKHLTNEASVHCTSILHPRIWSCFLEFRSFLDIALQPSFKERSLLDLKRDDVITIVTQSVITQ